MFRFVYNHSYCKQFTKNVHQAIENEYKKAIATLNSLQSNVKDLQKSVNPQYPSPNKLNRIHKFLFRCGLEAKDIEKNLSVIHVAGTKGKGSTCAFCESILRHHGMKTGLFTSPHLISVLERIQINGQPLSKEKFVSYFWDVYNKLINVSMSVSKSEQDEEMPNYFMFLTIMAFKVFKEEKVDVAIIEVGIGGEYDYTNFLSNTAVVGITSLGYDHVTLLGSTLEEIAWQKAGIIKPNSIVIVSADQPLVTLKVIRDRAIEKKSSSLFIAPKLDQYKVKNLDDLYLGIKGPVQRLNASLAIQLANAWLYPQNYANAKEYLSIAPAFELSEKIIAGLANCRWPGRMQTLQYSSKIIYYLDGAHNLESMRSCVEWFQDQMKHSANTGCKRALIFNITGPRNARPLMNILKPLKFDYVFFCCNRTSDGKNNIFDDNVNLQMSRNEEYARVQQLMDEWLEKRPFDEKSSSYNQHNLTVTKVNENYNYCTKEFSSAAAAHKFIKTISKSDEIRVLITGSLHLVGAFLNLLDPCFEKSV